MRVPLILSLLCCLGACGQSPATPPSPSADAPAATVSGGCLPDHQGKLEANLRGALEADLRWSDAQMTCDGDMRPDGKGLRLTMAGPLGDGRQLRFIIGIDLADTASGPAQALPTNLTVLVEGESPLLYSTRGDDKCAVE